jgi:hypothetical protein
MNSPLVSEGRRSVFLPYEKALMALALVSRIVAGGFGLAAGAVDHCGTAPPDLCAARWRPSSGRSALRLIRTCKSVSLSVQNDDRMPRDRRDSKVGGWAGDE